MLAGLLEGVIATNLRINSELFSAANKKTFRSWITIQKAKI